MPSASLSLQGKTNSWSCFHPTMDEENCKFESVKSKLLWPMLILDSCQKHLSLSLMCLVVSLAIFGKIPTNFVRKECMPFTIWAFDFTRWYKHYMCYKWRANFIRWYWGEFEKVGWLACPCIRLFLLLLFLEASILILTRRDLVYKMEICAWIICLIKCFLLIFNLSIFSFLVCPVMH